MAVLIDTSVLVNAGRRGESLDRSIGDEDRRTGAAAGYDRGSARARRHLGGLEQSGNLIGAHDLWIAATAVSHGMEVATANPAEFERVPGLTVVPV